MRKLRLELEELVVESFSTGEERAGSGTVHGRGKTDPDPMTDTCEVGGNCSFIDTCGEPSCGGAMVDSCGSCLAMADTGCAGLTSCCESADGRC